MSDFHSITPYGSKVCHGSVTGVTCDTTVVGCDRKHPGGSKQKDQIRQPELGCKTQMLASVCHHI